MLIRTIVFLCALGGVALSQTYNYRMRQGAQNYTTNIRPGGVLIMSGPADDTLSAWQPLPFAWTFWGRTVTGYRASDNGYITFDSLAAASVPDNAGAAKPDAPNDAIYGYWDDLHFSGDQQQWSNEIRTLTLGTAPNRAHVVMWVSAVPHGVEFSSANNVSFAIVLKESGGFEIVQIAGRKTVGALTGSMGCENADGTRATFVAGSPALDFPDLSASADDDISYAFEYSETANDLAVVAAALPKSAVRGAPVSVACTVKNVGTDAVTSFGLSYRAGAEPVRSTHVDGVTLAPNATMDVTHPDAWTPSSAGVLEPVTIAVSDPNGRPDERGDNDTLVAAVHTVLGANAARTVLVEEFTGAWCGWCPDGALQMQAVEAAHPGAALVSIHAGGTDAMVTPEGQEIATAFGTAYPMAAVDRVKFPGQAIIPLNRTNDAWLARVAEREAVPAPLSLSIDPHFDPGTRLLTADVAVACADYPYPGDLRLSVEVVEDRVVGSGRGYDQTNYYSHNSSFPNHPYYGETDPIVGFVHRHVLRAALAGAWGEAGVLPAAPEAGKTYPASYTWTLPQEVDEREVSIVAFVCYGDDAHRSVEVVNAAEVPLLPPDGVAGPTASPASPALALWPLPAHDRALARFDAPPGAAVRVELRDALGRLVRVATSGAASVTRVVTLDVYGLPAGLYSVSAIDRSGIRTAMLPVVR